MVIIVAIVSLVAGICVGVLAGDWVACTARPCRYCGDGAPYKTEPQDVLIREVLGQ